MSNVIDFHMKQQKILEREDALTICWMALNRARNVIDGYVDDADEVKYVFDRLEELMETVEVK